MTYPLDSSLEELIIKNCQLVSAAIKYKNYYPNLIKLDFSSNKLSSAPEFEFPLL